MKKAFKSGKIIIIVFNGSDFKYIYNKILAVYGSSFKQETKEWFIPNKKENRILLKKLGFKIYSDEPKDIKVKYKEMFPVNRNILKGLKEFQIQDLQNLVNHYGYLYNGNDCGTGKTIEGIGATLLFEGPFLIICPMIMKLKWKREIKKWTGRNSVVINGTTPYTLPKKKYYIINYNILTKWEDELLKLKIKGIIPDEAHKLGDYNANWTNCFDRLVKQIKPKLFFPLSGTPTLKRTRKLFPVLHAGWPNIFSNQTQFYLRYCGPTFDNFGWKYDGASHKKELNEILQKIMIRRKKRDKDVMPYLKPMKISFIPMELDKIEKKNYENLDKEFQNFIDKNVRNRTIISNHISALKQCAYLAKRNSVFEWIDDYLTKHKKLVLASWHKNVINDLHNRYKDSSVKIDGSVTGLKREKAENEFNSNDKIKIMIIQSDAGGEGIDLVSSSGIAIIEFPDSPGKIKQVGDRIDRFGQKKKPYMFFLFAEGTVENVIADSLEKYSKYLYAILDGKKDSLFKGNEDFDELIVRSKKGEKSIRTYK